MSEVFTIHQPMMFPPIYLMSRFLSVDTLVTLGRDNIKTDGWHTKFKLQSKTGPLIIPVWLRGRSDRPINEVQFDRPERFFGKLSKTLQQLYSKQPYYTPTMDLLSSLTPSSGFGEYCLAFLEGVFDYLHLESEGYVDIPMVLREESFRIDRPENASEWLASIGVKVGGTHYVCASDAPAKYLDVKPLQGEGISVLGQLYRMPEFDGITDATTSILDLLFRKSPDEVVAILRG